MAPEEGTLFIIAYLSNFEPDIAVEYMMQGIITIPIKPEIKRYVPVHQRIDHQRRLTL